MSTLYTVGTGAEIPWSLLRVYIVFSEVIDVNGFVER